MRFRMDAMIPTIASYLAETTKTPGTPGLAGPLIAWWICNSNKRSPIGGWLQYFYWTLYGGFLISLALLAMNSNSYIPESSGSTQNYLLFLSSAVPTVVLLFVQVIVGTFLLCVRTPEMLKLFRWTLGLSCVAAATGVVIDYFYNPVNMAFGSLTLISDFCWLLYFLRSVRVKHIFLHDDWGVAVLSMYPPKPLLPN
jgi:hypothetical protein